MITYETAFEYLKQNVKNERLIMHMKTVSLVTKHYAVGLKNTKIKLDGASKDEIENIDEFEWELAGLLHDADWESFPEKHPAVIVSWLIDQGAPDAIIKSIHSHANVDWAITQPGGNIALVTIGGEHQEIPRIIPRNTLLGKVLFACDEMTGLVYATALMKPNRLIDLTANSVMKKIKDKGFARGVNRDDLDLGVKELGISTEEHITNIIDALLPHQEEIFI